MKILVLFICLYYIIQNLIDILKYTIKDKETNLKKYIDILEKNLNKVKDSSYLIPEQILYITIVSTVTLYIAFNIILLLIVGVYAHTIFLSILLSSLKVVTNVNRAKFILNGFDNESLVKNKNSLYITTVAELIFTFIFFTVSFFLILM